MSTSHLPHIPCPPFSDPAALYTARWPSQSNPRLHPRLQRPLFVSSSPSPLPHYPCPPLSSHHPPGNAYYALFPTLAAHHHIATHSFDQRGWGRSVHTPAQRGL